jgi:hypothetical protein
LTVKTGGIVVSPQSESLYYCITVVALVGVHRFVTVDIWTCEESDGSISVNSNFGRALRKETRQTSYRCRDIGAVCQGANEAFPFSLNPGSEVSGTETKENCIRRLSPSDTFGIFRDFKHITGY